MTTEIFRAKYYRQREKTGRAAVSDQRLLALEKRIEALERELVALRLALEEQGVSVEDALLWLQQKGTVE